MSPLEADLEDGGRWTFDQEVAANFEAMLERSIPAYRLMRDAVLRAADPFLNGGYAEVLDIGCSTGETIADVLDSYPYAKVTGIDISEPMLDVACGRFVGLDNVNIYPFDLRAGFPSGLFNVIFSVLTLQFVGVSERQRVLNDVYEALMPSGVFILVEKTVARTTRGQAFQTEMYHRYKRDAGYTDEEVQRKALALDGVLTPLAAEANEGLLTRFAVVEPFWRWGPFVGWVCMP